MPRADLVTVLIALPTEYNADADGRRSAIEPEKFEQTATEIAARLGGGTLWKFEKGTAPRGFWWSRGVLYEDTLAMIETDMVDTPEQRSWLVGYARDVLLERFRQEAIYLRFYSGRAGLATFVVDAGTRVPVEA